MFGLPAVPKLLVQSVVAALVLAAGAWTVSCYGGSKYEQGVRDARAAELRRSRERMTAALDSAERRMTPVLDALIRENDSLRTASREARESAARAMARSRRAEAMVGQVPPADIDMAPPTVVALIDSLVASSRGLREETERLYLANAAVEAHNDSLAAEAVKWRDLYRDAREVADTAEEEIAILRRQKDPPRCGFKCGLAAGALTVAAILGTLFAVAQ